MGVCTGDRVEICRAVRRAVCRDDCTAIDRMGGYTAGCRTFLVYQCCVLVELWSSVQGFEKSFEQSFEQSFKRETPLDPPASTLGGQRCCKAFGKAFGRAFAELCTELRAELRAELLQGFVAFAELWLNSMF